MNCQECDGACCEAVGLPAPLASSDWERWIALRGRRISSRLVEVEVPCSALKGGRCAIYSDRPDVCRSFVAGGKACLTTVSRRRTPAQYARIREASDPETL